MSCIGRGVAASRWLCGVGSGCIRLYEVVDVACEVVTSFDVVAVEPFVFPRFKPAFHDAVGLWRSVAGSHVFQPGPLLEPDRNGDRSHRRPVVGDHDQRFDLAGVCVDAVGGQRTADQGLGFRWWPLRGGPSCRSAVLVVEIR